MIEIYSIYAYSDGGFCKQNIYFCMIKRKEICKLKFFESKLKYQIRKLEIRNKLINIT